MEAFKGKNHKIFVYFSILIPVGSFILQSSDTSRESWYSLLFHGFFTKKAVELVPWV
jgi:hypothetical protein